MAEVTALAPRHRHQRNELIFRTRGFWGNHTRSSPAGPAEQEEGGSLQKNGSVSISGEQRSIKGRHRLTSTSSTSRGNGGVFRPVARWRTRGNHQNRNIDILPAEVSEFLVNSLQSHFVGDVMSKKKKKKKEGEAFRATTQSKERLVLNLGNLHNTIRSVL